MTLNLGTFRDVNRIGVYSGYPDVATGTVRAVFWGEARLIREES
ncbi:MULTISPECIES: hypothetical protein [unclassified Kribbella]